jgi:diguanylate cyclase (GGDEF)-like protein/putative nucleotidyltransferase with HDIG domain
MSGLRPAWDTLAALLARGGEQLYAGYVAADGRRGEIYTGPGLEALLGGVAAAGVDPSAVWNAAIHAEDREGYGVFCHQLITGEPASVEYRLQGLDGELRWVLDRACPRRERLGDAVLVDGIVRDVTGEREREDDMLELLAELNSKTSELEQARLIAEQLATTDALTGLHNRRAVSEILSREVVRAGREKHSPGLLMLDIDHFKRINDQYGHATGDEALRVVAARLASRLRPYDAAARWGGEEFLALVMAVPDDAALARIANEIRESIADATVDTTQGQLQLTVSIGAARLRDEQGVEALIDAADTALYAAKRRGRNRVVMESDLGSADLQPEEPEAFRVAQAMALAASVREAIPPQHCEQVADLSGSVAQELGLPRQLVERCRLGGWLHDVGKLSLPDDVIHHAARGQSAAREVLRRHVIIGEQLVRRVPSLADAAPAIRHHHERFNGTGYPDGLAGDGIPIEARVVAVCDAFSAITNGRFYQDPRDQDAALEMIEASVGAWYDPIVVAALRRSLAKRVSIAADRLARTNAA